LFGKRPAYFDDDDSAGTTLPVITANAITAFQLDNVDQQTDTAATACSHKAADSGNWGKVAMCASFPERWHCLFKGDGAGTTDVSGGKDICMWTPYKYSDAGVTDAWGAAEWNRMHGFAKSDAATAGVLLGEPTATTEAACALACLSYNMLKQAENAAYENLFTGTINDVGSWNGGCISAHYNTYGSTDSKCRLYGTGETPSG